MRPRQTPTFEANVPGDLSGAGPKATELAAAFFGDPMPWQPHLLDVLLATGPDGKYRLHEAGMSVPRQNGKSWVVRARCFYGALMGERILYTCHHGDTSDEMFSELSAPFEDEDEPELKELLKHVRKTNGKQAIELKNGGCIRFTTRTDSGGRGKTFDVLVVDEAQELTESQQAAILPSISAGRRKNPQTIYLGTPPDPKSLGTVFSSIRRDVRRGASAMAWVEWGASEVGDKHDKSRWYEFNPSMGTLLSETAVQSESNQMQPETFARERLGWWAPNGGGKPLALDPADWKACEKEAPMEDGKLAFGVKFSPDGRTVAVSWALSEKGGPSYVELYDVASTDNGSMAVAEMLARRKSEIAAVCIDGKDAADALMRRLSDLGFPKRAVIPCTSAVAQAAASMLKDELRGRNVSHIASPALDESATKSIRRKIGENGGWGFGDGDASISAPVESAALALYASRTTKRDPRRGQEASY